MLRSCAGHAIKSFKLRGSSYSLVFVNPSLLRESERSSASRENGLKRGQAVHIHPQTFVLVQIRLISRAQTPNRTIAGRAQATARVEARVQGQLDAGAGAAGGGDCGQDDQVQKTYILASALRPHTHRHRHRTTPTLRAVGADYGLRPIRRVAAQHCGEDVASA
ncbi:hypothetical protein MSAN_02111400 [Mycena sanguinolenta]|uniref:Uncharacterized protein n=1 Tax=Mycena sanguinolenta TaxID=230812 RepID=A0A8H6XHW1_9AGAR|nr:hypothetical protein MSAN_02111400 [Mycena sanguinolenta]